MDDPTCGEADAQPLFLDEPADLPKRTRVHPVSIDALFHDEDAPGVSSPISCSGRVDWQELNLLDARVDEVDRSALSQRRTPLMIALIVSAAVLGFVIARALLI